MYRFLTKWLPSSRKHTWVYKCDLHWNTETSFSHTLTPKMNSGITLAIFRQSGKIPVQRDWLMTCVSGGVMIPSVCFQKASRKTIMHRAILRSKVYIYIYIYIYWYDYKPHKWTYAMEPCWQENVAVAVILVNDLYSYLPNCTWIRLLIWIPYVIVFGIIDQLMLRERYVSMSSHKPISVEFIWMKSITQQSNNFRNSSQMHHSLYLAEAVNDYYLEVQNNDTLFETSVFS